jgi:uncharacterized protein (TIGR03083 family)
MTAPVPDDLRRATALVVDALRPATDADWAVPAGDLEWSCRRTLEHLCNSLLLYAGSLATLAEADRPEVREERPASTTDEVLDQVEAAAAILARVCEATPPEARAFHPAGMADATGFLAMACDETLVHGRDIGEGLGIRLRPSDDLAVAVLERLFPWAPEHADPWEALLWCNGRMALPGRERLGTDWWWWSRPLEEWDGVTYTRTGPPRWS